jgi:hypothetical protein
MNKLYLFILLFSSSLFAQQKDTYAVEVSFLRGNVLPHSEDTHHLINGHPDGVMLSFINKTHGSAEWQKIYDFPDYGGYFLYQDFKSPQLGETYAVGALYNFYFLNRYMQLRLAQGIAVTTNPYNKVDNSKNKAFGTRILDNTNIGLSYTNQKLFKHIGINAGILFTHYSNGRVKSPNSGINTYMLNVGLNYNIDDERSIKNDTVRTDFKNYRQPIHYNFVFRTGINESPIIRTGQKPFYHLGFYADKRLNRKSGLQLGAELFLTNSLKDYIEYYSVAYPEFNSDATTDYKRIGVFAGYELFINRISLNAQLGYYVYQPFKKDTVIYDRVGANYYISDKIFASFAIKTHLFLAEALEFGIGYRL